MDTETWRERGSKREKREGMRETERARYKIDWGKHTWRHMTDNTRRGTLEQKTEM